MLRHGAQVFLVARGAEQLEATCEDLTRRWPGASCDSFVGDVSHPDDMERAVAAMREGMGGVGGVVCNAGFAVPGYFEQIPTEVFQRSVDVDYLGAVWTVRAALPHLEAGAFITLVSSVAGYLGTFGYSAYSGPKAALIGFGETLRQEVGARGVRVSVLCPADTKTPGLEEENRTKPFETRALSASAGLMEPDQVARRYVRALRRGRFLITVNAASWVFYRLKGWLPETVRRLMDGMVARARKKGRRGADPGMAAPGGPAR
jgi:3-dehydrosphinganine reductase